MDVRDDERLAQHLDHRDRRADARLEAKLDAGARGGVEELGAAPGDELLVRGDDVLAARGAARARARRPARRRPSPRRRSRSSGRRAISREVGREHAAVGREARARLSRSRTSALTTRSRWPVARSMSSACSFSSRLTAEPTVPYPSSATGTSTDAMRLLHLPVAERAQALADLLDLGLAERRARPRPGSGSPRSISAIHSRANEPSWIAREHLPHVLLDVRVDDARADRDASRTRRCRRSSSASARCPPSKIRSTISFTSWTHS